jgi:EAL domain-containing protein (putative c-di-GMP-specific phosphodiesterase class I)
LPGSDHKNAVFTCERLINLFAIPFQVDEHVLPVTASIGIALYPSHGADIVALTKHADTAMYEAKRQGRNAYVVYQQDIGDKIRQRISLEHRLRESLLKEEFRLVYQPIMDVTSGRLIGIEALLRWVDSEGRLRFPAEFIQVAEESGLILPLGEWVLQTACIQTKIWNDAGHDLWVAVNLSTRQFQDPNLVSKVIEVLRDTGLEPTRLELEITESAAMLNPQASIEILGRLKAMGVHIAIDDFGTGYSSLSYLKRIPADKIKIDKSFVDGVTNDPDDIAIVRTIIALANSLEMHTVAEGIETAEQLRAIEKYGCKQAQGYWISHPLPPETLEGLFDRFDVSSRHLASK